MKCSQENLVQHQRKRGLLNSTCTGQLQLARFLGSLNRQVLRRLTYRIRHVKQWHRAGTENTVSAIESVTETSLSTTKNRESGHKANAVGKKSGNLLSRNIAEDVCQNF